MDSPHLNGLAEELKKELDTEIKEAQDFLDWLYYRIEARSIDKDKGILDILVDLKNNQEVYLDRIRAEYIEKYS